MPKFKVKRGGETVEVEYDEIVEAPEGFRTQEEIENEFVSKDYFQSEVSRRLKNATKNARQELAEDDEFIRKQIRKRGGEFDDDGNLKTPKDVDIDKLTEDIRSEILEEEVEPLRSENQSLKSTQLSSQILRKGQKMGLTKDALRPIKSGRSAIEIMAEDNFQYHPEKKTWAQVDEEGNFLGGANGLRTIDDWYKDLKKEDDYQDWFKDQRQEGSGFNGGGGGPKQPSDERERNKKKVREIRGKN